MKHWCLDRVRWQVDMEVVANALLCLFIFELTKIAPAN